MGISEKLAYLNETKEQIKSALNTPYNVYRDYAKLIRKYVENQPKSIVEGEQAICENAIDLPCNVDINGNSYQETTEGYQLLDDSKLTIYSFYADLIKSIVGNLVTTTVLNGSEDTGNLSNVTVVINNDIPVEVGDYYISCDVRLLSGTAEVNSIQMTRSGTTDVATSNISRPTLTNTFQRHVRKYTINSATDSKAVNFLIQIINAENAVLEITNFQISRVDKPYEPYTNGVATPNTENPREIEVVEAINKLPTAPKYTYTANNVEISSDGEGGYRIVAETPASDNTYFNFQLDGDYIIQKGDYLHCMNEGISNNVAVALLSSTAQIMYTTPNVENRIIDLSDYEGEPISKLRLYINSGFTADITFTIMITNKSYSIPFIKAGCIGLVQRGKNIANYNDNINSHNFNIGDIKKGIDYTLVLDILNEARIGFNLKYNSDKTDIKSAFYSVTGRQVINFTSNRDDILYLNSYDVSGIYTGMKVMLLKGTYSSAEVGEYEPYIEPIVHSIDLAGNSLAKVSEDIKDNLLIGIDGSCRINKNIKEKIFNGLEKFANVENANSIGYFTNTDLIPDNASNDILCTHLKPIADLWNLTEQIDCIKVSANIKTQFNLMVKGFNDSPQLIAKLKELYDNGTPMKLLYATTNPTTIELPSIEPITLFEGTNIFELVTNLGTTLKVEYIVNAETLQNEITELENAVIELGGTL